MTSSLLFEAPPRPPLSVQGDVISGIDPGASGGIAHIVAGVLEVIPMPWIEKQGIDPYRVREFLLPSKHVFLEQVQVRPDENRHSTAVACTQWGRLRGIVEGLGIPLTIVHPQTWRKEMDCRIPSGGEAYERKRALKAKSVSVARSQWPRQRFLATERCKVPHDGMCEAALIAEFGRRKLSGKAWQFTGGDD